MTPCHEDYVRNAHDDLTAIIDYLRSGRSRMSYNDLSDSLDLFVLHRLKQALGVVQEGNIGRPKCTRKEGNSAKSL
jgi:hypothetical protein